MDAVEYCINSANCITAWPSGGGGGTISSIADGGGLTVTNPSGPAVTLSVIDSYVNTVGDSMTGPINMNLTDRAITVNSSALGLGNSMIKLKSLNGSSNYGIDIDMSDAVSSMGLNITNSGLGVSVSGGIQGIYASASDYAIKGFSTGNSAGQFESNTSYGIVGQTNNSGASGGYFWNSANDNSVHVAAYDQSLIVTGRSRFDGDVLITTSTKLCFGSSMDCRSSWPTSGTPGGSNTQIQYNNSGVFAGDSKMTWDSANSLFKVTGGVSSTAASGQVAGRFFNTAEGTSALFAGTSGAIITGRLVQYDSALPNSTGGLELAAADRPFITRAWDLFTSGKYANMGRWGLFMEPSAITIGMPNIAGKYFVVAKYNANSTKTDLLSVADSGKLFSAGDISTNGYFITSGGLISFDGTPDQTAMMQLYGNDMFLNLGANNTLYIRASGGTGTTNQPFKLQSGGDIHAYGSGSGYYFRDRSLTTKEWAMFSQGDYAYFYYSPDGASWSNKMQLSNTGNLWIAGAYSSSDERLKDLHGDYSKGLDAIMRINPYSYTFKQNNPLGLASDESRIGPTAQEIKKLIPEAVKTDDKGYLMMTLDPIVWTSVNAIKELKAENDKLKTQNESLEWRLRVLEAKMDALMK